MSYAGYCSIPKPKSQAERRKNRIAWQREQARLAAIKVPHLEFLPDTQVLLEARNEFHHGFASFERKQGFWSCIAYAPCLNFLRNLDPSSAKLELARRGYDWSWVRNSKVDIISPLGQA